MLEVKDLKKYYPIRKGFFLRHVGDVKAVDGVSFHLQKGKTLGVLGESGCGKSTLGKALIRLFEPTEGDVNFNGHNFLQQKGKDLQRLRSSMQMIFQDPFGSLDPRMTVGNIIREPLEVHGIGSKKSQKDKVQDLMAEVGLNPSHINRYPHEFSGGQRQRISIARCLALEPELIIADEPVSALDVSVQAQILNLMKDLQDKFGLTYIFISHDISVIDHMADDIMVMYLGKVVEHGPRESVLSKPQHPYTQALMNAIPLVGMKKAFKGQILQGDVPSPINPPKGCTFHPRCPHVEDKCKIQMPDLKVGHGAQNHKTRCWLNHKENEHVFQ